MHPPESMRVAILTLLASGLPSGFAEAQRSDAAASVTRIEAEPSAVVVTRGESAALRVAAYDRAGRVVDVPIRVTGARRALRYSDGAVQGLQAGDYELTASVVLPADAGRDPVLLRIPVTVLWPAVIAIRIDTPREVPYAGTTVKLGAEAVHADGTRRPEAEITWTTSDPGIASVDRYGYLTALGVGATTISASFEGVTAGMDYAVVPFGAVELELVGGADEVRTGDVQELDAIVRSATGDVIDDMAITWTMGFQPAEGIVAPAAPGQIEDGRMVADVPGVYTVMASAGPLSDTRRFSVVQREVIRPVEVLGQGRQTTHYTSDLWVFEGVDGRDYAMTGARQAQSHAFVWDITDPANIVKTDSIRVDARSVNDVKVSPDARYGVITREGASNRRNGMVILDMSNPAHPTIASVYDEGLTGGVHNVFATDDYLFALSGGDKYVILDVTDIYDPKYVSEYDHPDSRLHDVWVHDGIAYSAEWSTGVVMVDVGNGRWGGSIEAPRLIGAYKLPSDATHAVFPYLSQSTGRFLLFVGDEIVSRDGLAWEGNGPDHRQQYDPVTGRGGYPRATSGYIQILDLTDPENPEMIARYEVSEYGTHNIFVEDDILYQAYYEGGMRLVDVSGELMGNLYTQGREIAVFKPNDPLGWIPNAPATWGVFPYKGNIFFSDISSGLWSVRLGPEGRPVM